MDDFGPEGLMPVTLAVAGFEGLQIFGLCLRGIARVGGYQARYPHIRFI